MRLFKAIRMFGAMGLISVGSAAAWAQSDQSQKTKVGNATGTSVYTDYGRVQQSPWFSSPSIRQQLQLNDDQFNRLNQSYKQAWDRYNEGVSGIDRNLLDQQRMQRYQDLNGGFYKDFSGGIDEILADKVARQRYNQMDWQYRGYGAFNDPRVQKQLNLNEEQRQKFNQYDSEWNSQMNTWRRDWPTDREGIANRLRESRRELQNRINSTLTPQQRAIWTETSGKPFEIPADVYFPGDASTGSSSKPNIK